jgi:hypothetical protein
MSQNEPLLVQVPVHIFRLHSLTPMSRLLLIWLANFARRHKTTEVVDYMRFAPSDLGCSAAVEGSSKRRRRAVESGVARW